MAKTSTISWTDQTWNMIHAINLATGKRGWHCEHVTDACRNCYAETLNVRAGDSGGTGLAYKPGHRKDIDIFLNEDALRKPLHWRAPRKIFVCSMTDLFADFVPDEWLDRIFAVMALCPQHQFQVLTKRPARMRAYLTAVLAGERHLAQAARELPWANEIQADEKGDAVLALISKPLPNVWVGTSICDQADADKFVPELLHTPAAVRFLSCEPLLGPIDLTDVANNGDSTYDALRGHNANEAIDGLGAPALDWVICGGESGKEARPMHPDWARSLRDQCAGAGVAFHFKQWGEWSPGENADHPATKSEQTARWGNGKWDFSSLTPRESQELHRDDEPDLFRFGKARAGRWLDGIEHNEFPVTA